jgi:hypothetical protein
MRAVASVLSLSVLLPLTSLPAQEPFSLEPGAWIRITAPGAGADALAVEFVAIEGDTLRVQNVVNALPMQFPMASLTRFEVRRGRKSVGAVTYAALGAVAGTMMVLVAEPRQCLEDVEPECPAVEVRWELAAGAAAGALLGALAGTLIKTDRWEEVPLDQLRVSLAPQREGRLSIGLSVAF